MKTLFLIFLGLLISAFYSASHAAELAKFSVNIQGRCVHNCALPEIKTEVN